jgi:hypothetical protein
MPRNNAKVGSVKKGTAGYRTARRSAPTTRSYTKVGNRQEAFDAGRAQKNENFRKKATFPNNSVSRGSSNHGNASV